MTIQTSVPSSLLRPGTFQEFDVSAAQRGLVPIPWRVVCIGALSAGAPATVNVPRQIFATSDSDLAFNPGSELALMIRACFKAAAKYGFSPEIWAQPLADPGGGVKATKTFTFTGPATAGGNMEIQVAGRSIITAVRVGDVATAIATNFQKAASAIVSNLP